MSNENQIQNSAVVATIPTAPPADTSIIRENDIIEINAGGKIITTRRGTLTLVPNSLFTSMFSGRWALELDSNGRIFLDEDPEFIERIINFFRNKKREDPSNPIQSPPKVPEEKKEDFISLLGYYGLRDFFYPPLIVLDINNIDVVQLHDFAIKVTKSENKIQFYKSEHDNGNCDIVTCKPQLVSSGAGSCWKVTINTLIEYGLFIGIIGNLDASKVSFKDPTFYGWDLYKTVFFGGKMKLENSGPSRFTQGECLYFHLISSKLTMFSVQKNRKFIIGDIPTTAYYIHFNMFSFGDKLTLEPLNAEECVQLLQTLDGMDDDDTVL